MKKKRLNQFTILVGFLLGCALTLSFSARATDDLSPAEARAIAKEAYIYGFPMVDSYRIQYDYFTDAKNPEFKAPWNHIANIPRVTTPADTTAQTPNADTPYSWLGLDLRAEPIVLTMPVIPKERYFTVQLIDAYTFNFDYIGSRVTGNDGGAFLIAGPGWKGATPEWHNESHSRGHRLHLRFLSRTTLQSERYRQRQKSPGWLQSPDAFVVRGNTGSHGTSRLTSSSPSAARIRRLRSNSSTF